MLLRIQSRSFMMRTFALVAAVGLAVVSVCSPVVGDEEKKEIVLNGDAYALLNRNCFEFHGRDCQDGGLRLDSRQSLLEGGDSGEIVDLESVDESELLRRMAVARAPKDFELSALKNLFQQEKEFTKQPVPEDAAWYSVASALLNLDETIAKE
jgi:hypothetical protein